jgi:hypothetical protein
VRLEKAVLLQDMCCLFYDGYYVFMYRLGVLGVVGVVVVVLLLCLLPMFLLMESLLVF